MSATAITSECKEIHLIIDAPKHDDKKMSETTKKVLKSVAVVLLILGVSLLIGGGIFCGIGAFLAIPAAAFACIPTVLPLALTMLLAGCNLLMMSDRGTFKSKMITADLKIQ